MVVKPAKNSLKSETPRLRHVVGPLFVADLMDLTGLKNPHQLERQFASEYSRPRVAGLTAYTHIFSKLANGKRLPDPEGLITRMNRLHPALVRVFAMALLEPLSHMITMRDMEWYGGVWRALGPSSREKDTYGYRSRGKSKRSRNWLIAHCEGRNDSAALAMLLPHIRFSPYFSKQELASRGHLVVAARELAVRLTAFTPFYEARTPFWKYLEYHFFSRWNGTIQLRTVDLDQETMWIRSLISRLAENGLVNNEFRMQSRIAFWATCHRSITLDKEILALSNNSLRTIGPESELFKLLHHARCWLTREKKEISTQRTRKYNIPPRVANALDQVNKPYPDEIEHLRILPTEEEVESRIRLRKLIEDWRSRPPGPPNRHLASRMGLRTAMERSAGLKPYRLKNDSGA